MRPKGFSAMCEKGLERIIRRICFMGNRNYTKRRALRSRRRSHRRVKRWSKPRSESRRPKRGIEIIGGGRREAGFRPNSRNRVGGARRPGREAALGVRRRQNDAIKCGKPSAV